MSAIFYCANTTVKAVEMALSDLKEGKHAIIVPDRFTLSVEREFFERTGKTATFDVDVLSFSRLAVRILEGGGDCLSKEGAVMVLKKVLRKLQPELVHYGKAARKAGFAKELYAAIASFRVMGATHEEMRVASEKLEGGTAKKLKDIALLTEAYLKETKISHTDTLLRFGEAVKAAADCTYLKGRNVTFAGFDFFTGKQSEFIGALMGVVPAVRVTFCPTNFGKNSELYPMECFSALKRIAEEKGIPYRVEEERVFLPAPFSFLNENLFDYNNLTADGLNKVTLFSEPTVYEQFNAAAREIRRLVDTEGFRFREIAVLNPQPEYNVSLSDIFSRYRIPHCVDRSRTLAESAAASFVIGLVRCAAAGMKKDTTFRLLKNPLWGFSLKDRDLFENEALKRGVDFDGFGSTWETLGSEGEEIRNKIYEAVKKIPKGESTVNAFLYGIRAALNSCSENDVFKGAPDVDFENASRERLGAVLEEMGILMGEEPVDASAFCDQFAACAEAETVSVLPNYRDSVFVGNLGESRFTEIRTLIVVNAVAGAFPPDYGYQAVLSALDVEALASAGVQVYPTPMGQLRESQFRILDLFTKCERLYVGMAENTPLGTKNLSGTVFNELKRMLNLPVRRLNDEFLANCNDPEGLIRFAVTPENARFEVPILLGGAKGKAGLQAGVNLWHSLPKEERGAGISPVYAEVDGKRMLKGDVTKVSQLESYFRCPYAHLMNYGLRLRVRDEGDLRVTDVGTLFHTVLERYFRAFSAAKREGKPIPPPQPCVEEVVNEEKKKFRSLTKLQEFTLSAVRRQAVEVLIKLGERALKSGYTPTLFEAEFGMNENGMAGLEIEVGEKTFTLRGKIDRVDVREAEDGKGCICIDYKVGSGKHGEYKDIYYGTQIQLFIYLNALKQQGYLPEGALYLPIDFNVSKDKIAGELKLKGQILEGNGVLDALDPEFLPAFERDGAADSEIISLSAKRAKNGNEKVSGSEILSKEDMEGVLNYVKLLSAGALREISEGYAEKRPLENICERCDMLPVCGGGTAIRKSTVSEMGGIFRKGDEFDVDGRAK